ncbi:MAG: helix-turn-helix transcriptional regulator [Bacteroidales bacterium]|jgi:transcriptional regulator with XRE-family HTH domain|nr:helix-turn-helix transcriptional regulator [Bacteroidales bacterium]
MSFKDRLKQARTNKKISQQELAKRVGVHYTNIGRYERGEAVPSANVLNSLAQALDVTPDYLINGTLEDKADSAISDNELLIQFKKVEKLPEDKKKLVKEFLDAFLFKDNVQRQLVL